MKKLKRICKKETFKNKSRNNSEILDILNSEDMLFEKIFKIDKKTIQENKINAQKKTINFDNKVSSISYISDIIKTKTFIQNNKIDEITNKSEDVVIVFEKIKDEVLNENKKKKPILFWLIVKSIIFLLSILILIYNIKF